MKILLYAVGGVFLLTFLAAPTMGAGWFWDAGNGLGFAAFAGLVYMTITSNRRLDVRAHRLLAYAVCALALAHAFWFILGDAVVIEFLKIGAPGYMWLGVVSLLLLTILIAIAVVPDRLRVHRDYSEFRYWHRVITVATIAAAAYHIAASRFYLQTWYQVAIFALLACAVCIGRDVWIRLGQIAIATPAAYLGISAICIAVFVFIRNLPT